MGEINDILDVIKQVLLEIGIKNETVQTILFILGLASLFILLLNYLSKLINYIDSFVRRRKLIRDLHPFFTSREIEHATKYFIKTKFQNVPPTEDNEPGRNYIAAASQPLLPLFLKKAFKNNEDDNKYYLVLADSGMGKTTFMINLYLAYKYSLSCFWQKKKYEIKLFPLGHYSSIEEIAKIPDDLKVNTILLLDAFDEDNEAVLDYEKRLNELLDVVENPVIETPFFRSK